MSHYSVLVLSEPGQTIEELLAPYCEDDPTFFEFEEDEGGELDESTGRRGWWHNPEARWDWWVVGGRWAGYIAATEGSYGEPSSDFRYPEGRFDSALVADCDFYPGFETYAVLTPDGTWHEPGRMGWFCTTSATSEEEERFSATYRERFIDTADHDWTATVVDCHI